MPSLISRRWMLDTSSVPANFLSLRGAEFFRLVEDLTGRVVAEILRIQAIRDVRCFLSIEDVLEFFSFDSAELACLKKEACFHLNDGTYIVKIGVSVSIQYLRELFLARVREQYPVQYKTTIESDPDTTSSTERQSGTASNGQKRSIGSSEQIPNSKRGRK